MPKASAADLEQMYAHTVSIYKNKPYFVIRVNGKKVATAKNLLTQRDEELPICEETWSAPTQRLGFINVKGSILYLSRTPIRRYKVGLSKDNLQIRTIGGVNYPVGGGQTVAYVKDMTCIELADCIMGKYPTLPQAFAKCTAGDDAVAFDRQFAVDARGQIYYKTTVVGHLKTQRPKDIEDIQLYEAFTHLHSLLGNRHESIIQTSGA